MFCGVFKKASFRKKIAAYEDNGMFLDIIRVANEAIRAFPFDFEFYLARGKAWFIKGVDDRAILDFSKTIIMDPLDTEAHLFRALLYREDGEYDKGMADLNCVLEISPDDTASLNERGKIELARGEYEKAIADFSKVMEMEPDDEDSEIYQNRAEAYAKLGKIEESKADSLRFRFMQNKANPLEDNVEYDNDGDEDDGITQLIIDASKPLQAHSPISAKKRTALFYLCALLIIVAGAVLLSKFSWWLILLFPLVAGGIAGWIGADLEWNLKAQQKREEDLEKQRDVFVSKRNKFPLL